MTTQNIFTYGSLMFDIVWNEIVQGHYTSQPVQLNGFRRLKVNTETYPALVTGRSSDFVSGRMYFEVSPTDLQLLDYFEGEQYDRIPVLCHAEGETVVEAQTYQFKDSFQYLLSNESWDSTWFAEKGIHLFLRQYSGFRN